MHAIPRTPARRLTMVLLVLLAALTSACVTVYESEEDEAQVRAGNYGYIPEGGTHEFGPFMHEDDDGR